MRPKKVHTQLSTKTIKVTENRSNQDHLTRRGLQKGYGQASATRRGQKETSNLNSITFVAQIFLNRKEKKKFFLSLSLPWKRSKISISAMIFKPTTSAIGHTLAPACYLNNNFSTD
jgi:hypothetical protein